MHLKKWISVFIFMFAVTLLSSTVSAQEQQIITPHLLSDASSLASRPSNVPSVSVINYSINEIDSAMNYLSSIINEYNNLSYADKETTITQYIIPHIDNVWNDSWGATYGSYDGKKVIDKSTPELNEAMTALFQINYKSITSSPAKAKNILNVMKNAKSVLSRYTK